MLRRTLIGLLLCLAASSSLVAQDRLLATPPPATVDTGTTCVVGASILGGYAGAVLGGVIGVQIERALSGGNRDAGITGLALGVIFGALGGSQLARSACNAADELRALPLTDANTLEGSTFIGVGQDWVRWPSADAPPLRLERRPRP